MIATRVITEEHAWNCQTLTAMSASVLRDTKGLAAKLVRSYIYKKRKIAKRGLPGDFQNFTWVVPIGLSTHFGKFVKTWNRTRMLSVHWFIHQETYFNGDPSLVHFLLWRPRFLNALVISLLAQLLISFLSNNNLQRLQRTWRFIRIIPP